ncbi:probable capsid scaffolding protein [Aliivibrio fischeri ES114]|uniref:Probable capsid scaffolding protein n=1 Tax=Aliivibrio fischeri (strain ATCC 700601 / ES114) TaxID=312309 RepID=Q5E388_ALIF1|nr:GPO family capsid scaffolding protein [Aliivibrio fischeri]AAW86508.1 probable capsid scaffolding protein [Aliivibrio fischeri ES114]KLU79207.1 phage capsid scaffolding protein [Aliivibrio fischeri]
MFVSEPICILTAGPTVDGRNIEQSVIDDIAETYDPKRYNARINEEHWSWSDKFGSVLSVEKRDDQLFAVLKPNSLLLSTIEKGQLLHTSCEIRANFQGTGKSYLTGLALTDEPASVGTTEMHLSAKEKNKDKSYFSSGATISKDDLSNNIDVDVQEDRKFLSRLKQLLSLGEPDKTQSLEESEDMNEELKELLQAQTAAVTALTAQVTSLAATLNKEESAPVEEENNETELAEKVDALSTKLDDVVTKLSNITDEPNRNLAGVDGDTEYL